MQHTAHSASSCRRTYPSRVVVQHTTVYELLPSDLYRLEEGRGRAGGSGGQPHLEVAAAPYVSPRHHHGITTVITPLLQVMRSLVRIARPSSYRAGL